MFKKLYHYLLSEQEVVEALKIHKEESLQFFIRKKYCRDLILIRFLMFIIFVPISIFMFALIIYGVSSFLVDINMGAGDITLLLLVPVTLLFFMNVTNTSIIMIDSIKKTFITLKYLNPFYSTLKKPFLFIFKFIFELVLGFIYIIVSSLLTMGTIFDSLGMDFYNSVTSKDGGISLEFSIFVLHTSIYLFIRVYGHPFRTTNQKMKKLKMKCYLWFCSLIVSIVYIFASIFNHMNGSQAIYFIFALMIALERTVTHYKNFIVFLQNENLYEEVKTKRNTDLSESN
ncbi:hypothetical protein I6G76_00205 (plasmid) [Bacillus cereus]|uniref:Uncharacterized protein n=1 Tax=Bacillus cereus (strain ZK / E33L) TaxID=288681 RepID=Q4V1T1_BACCZ|nr:hypothetical protein [Bacillus cereus]AAY60326.1 hypothetical protein pE33L466_0168 [Bacillus cereus E33L]AJI26354.1 putative membrane protein [Bacillus cereus E33L]QQA19138.1 hypothetical protein I6G76_00205 [Bacillus cereus]